MADLLDVLTFDEASSGLLNLPADNGLLPLYITGVSRKLDDLCGPIVVRSVTERHDGGGEFIRPLKQPVAAVTELTEYTAGTGTVLTEEVDGSGGDWANVDGWLARRANGNCSAWAAGRNSVKVVYDAGRYPSTLEVDETFKMAAHLCLQHIWLTSQGGQGDFGQPLTYAIPRAAVELLGNEVRTSLLEGLR